MTRGLVLLTVVFVPMLAEARRSRRHERALRAAGACEPAGDVYGAMQVAYPLTFLAMIAEGWHRPPRQPVLAAGAVIFGLGKGLKYWAIRTLGPRWTFRVLVPPGAPRLTDGPYRWLRHPNYAGVIGELAGVALIARAPRTGLASLLGFGALMLVRIAVEERALGGT
jgi:methyltransferase